MSNNNRVIWSEGMFLLPLHFQQHMRHVEWLVEHRAATTGSYQWGIREFELDEEMLSLGKIGVAKSTGVMPDGTPFKFPAEDRSPEPREIPDAAKNELVYLGLAIRRVGQAEINRSSEPNPLARYLTDDQGVRDTIDDSDAQSEIQVGNLQLRLLLESDERAAFACLPIARVIEVRADKTVVLDEDFIPSCTECLAVPKLNGYIEEAVGLLKHRGEAIAARLGQAAGGETADYMLLQVVNRMEPFFRHLASASLHPERLFGELLRLVGDLSSFTLSSRRPPELPVYKHEDLLATFAPVMRVLRQELSMVLEQNAIPIDLQERKYGIRVAPIADPGLITSAQFILAVKASMPAEQVQTRFPTQVKIGPVEKIRQLVNVQLPGIGLRALPVAPRQLPYHQGFTYFELDRTHELWKALQQSGGFAFHIAGEFPGLELEFWAIREGKR